MNFVAFVVFKIFYKFASMQNYLKITADISKTLKTVSDILTFIFDALSELLIVFLSFLFFCFFGSALLCVTMRKRARAFVATIFCITFSFSFWH